VIPVGARGGAREAACMVRVGRSPQGKGGADATG